MKIEPISKETVELVDDFVSHLSENQMEEMRLKYKASQPYFADFFFDKEMFSKNKNQQLLIDKIAIVLFICFDRYGYELVPFDTVMHSDLIKNWAEIFKRERKSLSTSKRFKMIIGNSNQSELLNYVTTNFDSKLNGMNIFSKEDLTCLLSNFLFFIDSMHVQLKTAIAIKENI